MFASQVNRCAPGTRGMAGGAGNSGTAVRSIVVYGGVAKMPQARALREGVGVVVATPGRLIDLVNDGVVSLSGVDYLVLDEVRRESREGERGGGARGDGED